MYSASDRGSELGVLGKMRDLQLDYLALDRRALKRRATGISEA
jgi:hypothetical protein